MGSIEVEIFGRKYKLKGEDTNKLRQIAERFNQILLEISNEHEMLEYSKLLVLCGLQLQDKVYDLSQTNRELREELDHVNEIISSVLQDSHKK